MTFTAELACFPDSPLWGYYLPVSGAQGAPFVEGDDRRVICTLEDSHRMHAALMPRGEGFFILINKQIRDKFGLSLGDPVKVHLEKDRSEYGMPMPEELMVTLAQDEGAHRYFHALTPGRQRTLIYVVAKVKNPDSRIRKALAIAEHLNTSRGKLDFKALNLVIKRYNNL